MSYDAERWARSQKVGNSSAKFVLIELANALNRKDVESFPSIEALEVVTELNRKTIIAATKLLEERGFIKKRRTFENGKQRIYYSFPTFNPEEWASNKSTESGTFENTENGTLVPQSPKIGTLESTNIGTTESPKNGTDDSTENGTLESTNIGSVTRNKNKEVNKESNKESLPAPASGDLFDEPVQMVEEPKPKKQATDRGSRFNIEKLPDEWKAFAEAEEPDLDPCRLFDNFHDYWTSVSGANGIKKDWMATWRNFVRSFKNAPDWKRRPMLKPEAASRPLPNKNNQSRFEGHDNDFSCIYGD